MRRSFWTVVVMSAALSVSAWAAVSNDDVAAANREYSRLLAEAKSKNPTLSTLSGGDMGDLADEAFAKIPLDQLSVEQIHMILNAAPVRFSLKLLPAIEADLTKAMAASDLSGAEAAIMRLELLQATTTPEDIQSRVEAALKHPATAEAVRQGFGPTLFEISEQLSPAAMVEMRDQINALAAGVSPDSSVATFDQGARLAIAIAGKQDNKTIQTFSPFREKLAAALATKLHGQLSEDDHLKAERALARLNGAYARGEFIGHPAPPIEFAYYRDMSDPTKQIRSLADLKGKVVVLDFWATWCGPCVASFPKVKALTRYYRGFDVVVVSMTSAQGYVSTGSAHIDTKGAPDKEYALTTDFAKEKEVTWPIAFSQSDVFNPDYGVTGIPDVVIIDTAGNVRYADLRPDTPLPEKTAVIDKLLGEGGKTIPASMLMSKPVAPAQ